MLLNIKGGSMKKNINSYDDVIRYTNIDRIIITDSEYRGFIKLKSCNIYYQINYRPNTPFDGIGYLDGWIMHELPSEEFSYNLSILLENIKLSCFNPYILVNNLQYHEYVVEVSGHNNCYKIFNALNNRIEDIPDDKIVANHRTSLFRCDYNEL